MTTQSPVDDYAVARRAMVDSQLRPQGVNDPLVVQAMGAVAREQFVPDENRPVAYLDRSVPIGEGRSLVPAVATGLLLTAMALRPRDRVLVVGPQTGYSAAVLAAMGVDVTVVNETGEPGPNAGYDAILIDGPVERLPDAVIDLLKDGGTVGYAAIDRGVSRLTVGRKAGAALGLRTIADGALEPIPGFERPPAFTF